MTACKMSSQRRLGLVLRQAQPQRQLHSRQLLNSCAIPPVQTHPAAWTGPQMAANPEEWTWQLTPAEASEIEAAACTILDRGGGPALVRDAAAFPLSPALAGRLVDLRRTLTHGRGFLLVTGLPLHTWPRERAAVAFLGIGAHVGTARSQNAHGHVLGHVRDLGVASKGNSSVRIYQTSERQTFHCDSADCVALACLQDAAEGGESLVCSALTVWNEILKLGRADLAAALLEPVPVDRRGEIPEGCLPFFMAPPLYWHDGLLGAGAGYQRQYITSAQERLDVPPLSPLQIEALDLFDSLLDSPDLHLEMKMRPGDMQFVYNHTLLHDRRAFTDHPDSERRRHLFRLWLSPPEDRSLPPFFAERFGSVTVGDRGGIRVSGTQLKVTLDAAPVQ